MMVMVFVIIDIDSVLFRIYVEVSMLNRGESVLSMSVFMFSCVIIQLNKVMLMMFISMFWQVFCSSSVEVGLLKVCVFSYGSVSSMQSSDSICVSVIVFRGVIFQV